MQECESTRNQRRSEVRTTFMMVNCGKNLLIIKRSLFCLSRIAMDYFLVPAIWTCDILCWGSLHICSQSSTTKSFQDKEHHSCWGHSRSKRAIFDNQYTRFVERGFLKSTFHCAHLGVSCDIPAGRKVCGFLGHSVNLGCTLYSLSAKLFINYITPEFW